MKLTSYDVRTRTSHSFNDVTEAMAYYIGRVHLTAAEAMLARYLQLKINRRELTAHEVSEIFGYEVLAEDDA